VGHFGERIQVALGDGRRFDMTLQYSFDGPTLIGTGGAIRNALPLLGDAFLVLYGDTYLQCDYAAVALSFLASEKMGLMTVLHEDRFRQDDWNRANVLFENGYIRRYDKRNTTPDMRHIDYGLSAFRACAFERYSPGEPLDLSTVQRDLAEQGQLIGFEVVERFYEIGSLKALTETRRYLESRMTYAQQHLDETARILAQLDTGVIERMAQLLADLRARNGRLFFLGVGGSAANCSHAVNDFRKIADIEAYAPTDNISELTARTNDEGWASVFSGWLKVSRLNANDMLFVLSVGGGSVEQGISPNLVSALQYSRQVGAQVIGIVGRDGGYTAHVADACVIVPTINPANATPHTETFQAVIWHLLVSHPSLKITQTKWESTR
jgi:D-sedoheptulose 7-phosphate isomerase